MSLTIGSVFSGIDGLALGLIRAGWGPVLWQVEIDPFCQQVLQHRFPGSRKYGDIREVQKGTLEKVDVFCGGFPCQDVSSAGKREGLSGPKSGLWTEFRRIIEENQPEWVVIENVASGHRRWLPRVRFDLELLDYSSCAYSLSAAEVGAPHLRRRIFVVANSNSEHFLKQQGGEGGTSREDSLFPGIARENGVAQDSERLQALCSSSSWPSPPRFSRVDDGFPYRMDRNKALGNAVVPQCMEIIGRILMEARQTRVWP
jgi:DNA (cytosine-5)-methyltransferase 1